MNIKNIVNLIDPKLEICLPKQWLINCDSSNKVNLTDFLKEMNNFSNNILKEPIKEQFIYYAMHIRTYASYNYHGDLIEQGTFFKALLSVPYLKKLGVTHIYLLPIQERGSYKKKGELGSPYAISDPYKLDETLNDALISKFLNIDQQFELLINYCHLCGIKIVLDIVPRTLSRDNILLSQSPESFYWIKKDLEEEFSPPFIDGLPMYSEPHFENLHLIYNDKKMNKYLQSFTLPPNKLNPTLWEKMINKEELNLEKIENLFNITTVPGFADTINDSQEMWSDITFCKFYHKNNSVVSNLLGHDNNYHISYEGVKSKRFPGEHPNLYIIEYLANIIPYYQEKFNIDGARIDMAHAIPDVLENKIIEYARKKNPHFIFISEEHSISKDNLKNFDILIGDTWWHLPRIKSINYLDYLKRVDEEGVPYFSTAELPDTPRISNRNDTDIDSRIFHLINRFNVNGIFFINSGFEFFEKYPLNLGLDPDEYNLNVEAHDYKGLGFFEKSHLNWDSNDNSLIDDIKFINRFFAHYNNLSDHKITYEWSTNGIHVFYLKIYLNNEVVGFLIINLSTNNVSLDSFNLEFSSCSTYGSNQDSTNLDYNQFHFYYKGEFIR